jgi:aspartate-semialdehyde dehydrogenase
MTTAYNVAIIGATGIVGSTTLSILEERNFPIGQLHLLASERSAGETRLFNGKPIIIEDLATFDFSKTTLSFFCAGNDISAQYAEKAASLGNIVIDKSSHYRYDTDIPLVVPEVNEASIAQFRNKNIIANPNCNTIPLVVALKPIYDQVGITRINVVTYQSVSGGGKEAMVELSEQTHQIMEGKPIHPKIFPQQIAFNVLPHIDSFQANGYTREEMKIVWEMRKIFNDDAIAINPTAVRVPVYCGHSAAVHLETHQRLSAADALAILNTAPGVKVISGDHPYPTPVKDAAGKDAVYVGRIREDLSHTHGLNFWIVTDNLRKGAALNGIQIAEKLVAHYLS